MPCRDSSYHLESSSSCYRTCWACLASTLIVIHTDRCWEESPRTAHISLHSIYTGLKIYITLRRSLPLESVASNNVILVGTA
ncbi:hypothetical protein VDGL01_09167 [Verticillium dahliae]